MGAHVTIKDTDKGWNRIRMMARGLEGKGSFVQVGVLGAAGSERRQTKREHTATAAVKRDAKGRILPGSGKKTKAAAGTASLSNLEVAMVHEFGAPARGIPERSFLRSAFDQNRARYEALVVKSIPLVYEGKLSVSKLLHVLGQMAQSDIKNGITHGDGIGPALKPATVKRKGSSRPLVDTGQLLNSITYRVYLVGVSEDGE